MRDLNELLGPATSALEHAATLCQRVREQLGENALEKSDLSPVTVADFGSQALVCAALQEAFPQIPIVGEEDSADLAKPENAHVLAAVVRAVREVRPSASESDIRRWIDLGGADASGDLYWTLDPIDGTKGYLRGGQYAVALGLIQEGRVVMGLLACPSMAYCKGGYGVLGWAIRGQGAHAGAIGKQAVDLGRVRVSQLSEPAHARICESVESGHSKQDQSAAIAERLGVQAKPVRLDSQTKYAFLGTGQAEIYLRLPTRADYREKIWDHAAGALLVEEAGGRVTDIHGCPLDFSKGRELSDNRGVVATNGHLHDAVLSAIRDVIG